MNLIEGFHLNDCSFFVQIKHNRYLEDLHQFELFLMKDILLKLYRLSLTNLKYFIRLKSQRERRQKFQVRQDLIKFELGRNVI